MTEVYTFPDGWMKSLAKEFEPEPKEFPRYDTGTLQFTVDIITDGTVTEATIHDGNEYDDGFFARGVARRRKGERRNKAVGEALALARAYEQMAESYYARAEKEGGWRQ